MCVFLKVGLEDSNLHWACEQEGATGEEVVEAVEDQMDLLDSQLRQGQRSCHIIAVADPIQIYPVPAGHDEEQHEDVAVPIIPPKVP